jgi:CRISPR/Cas system CMR-associated protein Cmr5 small subunit
MAGLNYGNSFTKKRGMYKNKKVGVSYAELADKWIVRILKNGTVTTIAQFKTKEEADEYYGALAV